MRTSSLNKWFFRLGIILIVVFTLVAESGVTLALDSLRINIAFDQTVVSIGQTPTLSIDITSASVQPIRVTSLQCTASDGHVLTSNSINPMPSSIPYSGFHTQQLYRANAAGNSQVTCTIHGINALGDSVAAVSNTAGVNVLQDTGLYIYASSGTHVATPGQAIYVDITVGNRSKSPFAIDDLSCGETGPIIPLSLQTTPPSNTLAAGQIDFVQYRGFADGRGNLGIQCAISATSANGTAIKLFAPVINITVK